jgi:hypothetical protein
VGHDERINGEAELCSRNNMTDAIPDFLIPHKEVEDTCSRGINDDAWFLHPLGQGTQIFIFFN